MPLKQALITFIVLLNPFAQAILIWDWMRHQDWKEFAHTYGRASLLSYGVYAVFIAFGDLIVERIFHVELSSLQIFGGTLMLVVSFRNILMGTRTHLMIETHNRDIAAELSLPYIIGPATLWLSILIGKSDTPFSGAIGVLAIMTGNWLLLTLITAIMDRLRSHSETLLGRYLAILMRTNSLFIGAIGVDMIISAVKQLF